MNVVFVAVGLLIIAAGLADVFLTVLHYEDPGLLAVPAYRLMWEALRRGPEILPGRARVMARSVVAPFMVLLNIAFWLGLQIVGFACVYYPGVRGGKFDVGQLGHTFATALYVSAATFSSLSFSDVEPRTLAYHFAAAAETLVGLGVLTLVITYVLSLYRVLHEEGVMATRLFHRSGGASEPHRLLAPHFACGAERGVSSVVQDLHAGLVSYHEGIRRYPLVWYFRTRRPSRSLPYIFWVTAAVAAALRWATPPDHPAARDPWLPGLVTGFEDVLDEVAERFLPQPLPPPPEPVSIDVFRSISETAADGAGERALRRFLQVEAAMYELSGSIPGSRSADRYQRYREWTRFTGRARAFVDLASRDLGMDANLMYEDPSRIQP